MSRIAENGIWSLEIAKKRHKCDEGLIKTIWKIYKPNSVADIGCGNGAYCKLLKELGSKVVHGYEGTEGVDKLGYYSNITQVDLTVPLNLNLKYDLVLCLEVAEHIPKKYEVQFLKNLVSFVRNILIISWAPPGQYSASGHVNPHTKEEVKNLFVQKGFYYNEVATNCLKQSSQLPWFRTNLLVFELEKTGL